MAGRRTSLAALAGQKVEDVPGRSEPTLLRLPLNRLIPTRFNPRSNFGTQEELAEFGEALRRQQLHPAVIVSRAAYLKLWPEETDAVGAVPYVIANGERRYRAARAAGLTHLDVVLREEVAATKAAFLDAVLSENIDRRNLDPIEQAQGVQTMVDELGSARAVAEHYGRHETWVSQQRALLKLAPPLQELVRSGEMPVRFARSIYSLPALEQEAAWEAEQQRRVEAKAVPRTRRKATGLPPVPEPTVPAPGPVNGSPRAGGSGPGETFTAVKPKPPQGGTDAAGGQTSAVPPQTVPAPAAPDPTPPATDAAPDRSTVTLPLHNPGAVCMILRDRMEPENLRTLVRLLSQALAD